MVSTLRKLGLLSAAIAGFATASSAAEAHDVHVRPGEAIAYGIAHAVLGYPGYYFYYEPGYYSGYLHRHRHVYVPRHRGHHFSAPHHRHRHFNGHHFQRRHDGHHRNAHRDHRRHDFRDGRRGRDWDRGHDRRGRDGRGRDRRRRGH